MEKKGSRYTEKEIWDMYVQGYEKRALEEYRKLKGYEKSVTEKDEYERQVK